MTKNLKITPRITLDKLKSNDYPGETSKAIEQVSSVVNPGFDKINSLLNKNLTVDEHLPFEFVNLEVSVDSNGVPTSNRAIKTKLKKFKGFICIAAFNLSNTSVTPTTCPFIIFTLTGDFDIRIDKILGLPASTKYRLTLMGIS